MSNFTFLLLSKVFKTISDNFVSIALVWLLIETGGGTVSTSILYVCTLVPQMLLGLFISPFLTGARLQVWMAYSDAVRAFMIFVIPICYYLDILQVWFFFVIAVIQSITATIYNPSSVALLPRIIEAEKLQSANAHLASVTQIVNLVGLAIAGVLVSTLSASTTLILTCCLLIISSLLVLLVKETDNEETRIARNKINFRAYFQRIKEGFVQVKEHKVISGLTMYAIFINIGTIPWLSLSAIYVAGQLSGNAVMLSVIRASTAIGALLMGVVLAKIKINQHGRFFLYAGAISGLVLTILGLIPSFYVVLVCCFLLGATETAINIPEMVLIQTTVPQAQQAQVFVTLVTISTFFLPLTILISAPLAKVFGMGSIIAFGGMLIVLSGIVIRFFTPLAKKIP